MRNGAGRRWTGQASDAPHLPPAPSKPLPCGCRPVGADCVALTELDPVLKGFDHGFDSGE
jgi:hypothetical protein